MGEYDDHGNFDGAESAFYFGLSVGDTIQFYEMELQPRSLPLSQKSQLLIAKRLWLEAVQISHK